jgi:predicted RNase H-like HicB family nuclease
VTRYPAPRYARGMARKSLAGRIRILKSVAAREHALRKKPSEPTPDAGLKLVMRVHADTLDGGYVAEVVGLPGCMSQGETPEEAIRNTLDAYHEILEDNVMDALGTMAPPRADIQTDTRVVLTPQ